MSYRDYSLENKLIAKNFILQFAWGIVLLGSLVYQLIHEYQEYVQTGIHKSFINHDTINSLLIHILFFIIGILFIRITGRSFKKKIAEYETLMLQLKESQENYRQLFNQMSFGFACHEIILDEAGKPCDYSFIDVNSAFEEMLGISANDLIGKTVCELFPKTENYWIETYGNVATTGVPVQFENYSQELDRWFEVNAYSVKAGQFITIVKDVTERDKMAEALREYQYIIENSNDMIVSLDENHKYQMANRAFCENRGFLLDNVIGKTPEDIFGSDLYYTTIKLNLEKAFLGESVKFFIDFENLDKDFRRIQVTYQPMLRDDATVKRVFGFIVDVTERLELEEQLRQSQRMESIGTLAGGVAHDFNNILTVIMGSGTYLQMALAENSELEPFATQIVLSSERAARLTQSLLAFSRKQTMQVEQFDLNDLVKIIRDFLGNLLGENLKMEISFSPEPLMLCADRGQIEQVLMNLVVNARDAMPEGGVIHIATSAIEHNIEFEPFEGCHSGKYALISIIDTGCGINEKIRSRVFEPFFTTKDVGQGTGLGLSVAYGIVRQHEGNIMVESEVGKGSTFKVYLPIVNNTCSPFESDAQNKLIGGTETILLVEDDDDVRFVNSIILKNVGYNVIEAINAEEALQILHHQMEKVSLAVMDIMMPRMNGKELADLCQSFLPNLPVLFVTGYGTEALGIKGIVTEHINLIKKPLNLPVFLSKVRELIDRSNLK